ncbi:site-2 protease family protein [bacterium]|nr:MAG: site-2 protease family protein [bacterium]
MRDVSPRSERHWVHYALFAATFLTTTIAGSLQKGINPLKQPVGLLEGLPFSFTIMIILLGHEMGHYLTSRYHRVPATLPYFIPAPSIIGTFGAVIKMRGAIWDRRTLLDIGASGPIVGFLLALPALIIGFILSPVVAAGHEAGGLVLGDSLIVILIGFLTKGNLPESANVVLHPVGFAGWLGMFVTSLNLLPVGQLDGGHISKALFPNYSDMLARVVHAGLFLMGFLFWEGWLIWAFLLVFLGIGHPPVILPHIELDPGRRKVGFAAAFIFFLTFVPAPFAVL